MACVALSLVKHVRHQFTLQLHSSKTSKRRRYGTCIRSLRKEDCFSFIQLLSPTPRRRRFRTMYSDSVLVSDLIAEGVSGGVALSLLKLWEHTARRGVFDQV